MKATTLLQHREGHCALLQASLFAMHRSTCSSKPLWLSARPPIPTTRQLSFRTSAASSMPSLPAHAS